MKNSLLVLALGVSGVATAAAERGYVLMNIDRIGATELQAVKNSKCADGTVELGDIMLVWGEPDVCERDWGRMVLAQLETPVATERLRMIQMDHAFPVKILKADFLARRGRFLVVQAHVGMEPELVVEEGMKPSEMPQWRAIAMDRENVLMRQVYNDDSDEWKTGAPKSTLFQAVERVDGERWFADVRYLAGLNRHTRSPQAVVARDWMVTELSELAGLQVETQEFQSGGPAWNVIATQRGTVNPDRWIVVGGHIDSISERPSTAAPGAEDNASGAAGVLEIARVLSTEALPWSVIYIAFGAEEQGLDGSEAWAARLASQGLTGKIAGVINMDMIAFSRDQTFDVLLETGNVGQGMLTSLKWAAAQYTPMRVYVSMNPFGSDHMPFINRGIPAVLTIDNDWDAYGHYHRTTDTVEKLSVGMGTNILKMNVGTVLKMMESGG